MKKWIEQYVFNRKWMCRYAFTIFVLSLIPLFLIAYYDHPCADDFSYGNHTISTWRETGSIIQTISAAKNGTEHVYNTWQGSFAAVFLMTLHPAVFGENLYMLVPIILILGFASATMLLLKIIFMNYLGADKYSYGIIAIIISFLSMQFLISPVQAFYWYNGAMYYTGFYTLALILFSVVLLAMKTDNVHTSVIYAIIVSILSFLIGGSNFVVSLTSSIIMALFFTYRLVFKRNKWLIPLLGLLAICAALLISASAPGNTIRQEHFQGMNPIAAVITSFEQSARFVMYFVQKPIYFAFAFIVSLLYKIASNSKFSFRWPGAVTILLYSVYASNYTPNLYAMSSFGPARVANVNYYVFLLFLLFTTVYWCGWIARKFPYKSSRSEIKKKQPTKDLSVESTVNGLLAICFIFGCLILSSYNINTITSVSAIKSLVTGETKTYHEEYLSRLELYTNSEIRQIEVPAFTARPYVLYFDDITPDSDDWRNISLASYYNKDSIVVKE